MPLLKLRRFHLFRSEDPSNVSGLGVVAYGCQLISGRIVLEWVGEVDSIVIHRNIADVERIHGHDKRTQVIWEDD